MEQGRDNLILSKNLNAVLDVIGKGLVNETRRNFKPYRDNSYRCAYAAIQAKCLVTNMLRYLVDKFGDPPEVTQRIYRQSEKEAKESLKHLSPQIAEIIRENERKIDETREAED